MNRNTLNIIQLGFGMLLVFFAFFSQSFIVETVVQNRHDEDPSVWKHAGYYSQMLAYVSFVLGNLAAPTLLSILGPRLSFICAALPSPIYMSGFLFFNQYFLYGSCIVAGFMAGCLWTSIGKYVAANSDEKTISRHSNLMVFIYMPSMIFGGTFLLVVFGSRTDQKISMETTRLLFGIFAVVNFIGVITLGLLPQKRKNDRHSTNHFKELVKTVKLFTTRDQWLLAVPSAFTGIETSFFTSVYPTALSFTKSFSMNTNQLMGLNAIATGAGELFGAAFFAWSSKWTDRIGRWPLMWIGTGISLISYALIAYNLPANSTHTMTNEKPIASSPSITIGLICGFMLGFVDCCVNTRIMSHIAIRYSEDPAPSYALFNFWLALFTASCLFYGSVASLYMQLGLLSVGSLASAITYTIADRNLMNNLKLTKGTIPEVKKP
ncbi:unnamed protein product, partial [Mesorhabditis belari]|uniref:UNC93-like protein MFSD11 n=1 Tax=Mesorhabditis belari TaxID=2138241 RepID=A0AAF3FIA7_9BILA